jgi:hypothetical protein
MTQTSDQRIPLIKQLRVSLLIALPLFLIVNGIVWSAYSTLMKQQLAQWLIQTEGGLDAALITIERERNNLYGDLFLLAGSPNLKSALDHTTPLTLDKLAAEWEVFSAIKRRYDQIRWIDNQGRERLRVNLIPQGAVRVSDEQLQDKSNRYYFKEAISLQSGQIYASPIDLNIEHSEIELPYKPMFRLAVPVTDSRGERRGLVLVNVLAEYILDDLARHAGLWQSHLLMIDPKGYYLLGFRKEQEWGFMFQGRDDAEHRFDKRFPAVWRQLVQDGAGKVEAPQGQFLFRTVRYGAEGFGQRYFLLAAVLSRELEDLRASQQELWLSVAMLVSLIVALMSLFFSRYLICCRKID